MARSRKSSILIAHGISWGGAVVCALIATYGTHGPARHPKMMVICLFILAAMPLASLRRKGGSLQVLVAHAILWVIAAATAFTLANTSIGDGIHPIATTAAMLFLGAISFGILINAKFDGAVAEQETSAK